MLEVRSTTFGIRTRDLAAARDWYARVLGREPDLDPVEGVLLSLYEDLRGG